MNGLRIKRRLENGSYRRIDRNSTKIISGKWGKAQLRRLGFSPSQVTSNDEQNKRKND